MAFGSLCCAVSRKKVLDECTVLPYTPSMIIRSVQHRGLLRLIEDDKSSELRSDLVKRLRNILAALIVAPNMSAVSGPPGWKIHQLKAIAPERGAFQRAAIGALRSTSKKEKSAT
jgi:hypothetical protein